MVLQIRPYSIRDVKMPSTNLPEFESTIQVGFIVWDFRKNKFCFRRRIVNDKVFLATAQLATLVLTVYSQIEEFPWIGRDGKSVKAPIDAAIWDRVTLF